jgi:PIN domain nuclease of toxin-antitoxin system
LSKLAFHHRDPFDRLIISQSIANEFTLISKDSAFSNYEIKLLW